MIRFEPERVTRTEEGAPIMFRAEWRSGEVTLERMARRVVLRVRRDGRFLEIEEGTETRRFEALEDVPPVFRPEPLRLGEPTAVPEDEIASIRRDLVRRAGEDQAMRRNPSHPEEIRRVEGDNAAWLSGIVGRVGWIDVSRFGREAADAAFVLVQQGGNLPLMLAVLPEIEKEVREKRRDPQNFALLFDRLQLLQGYRQRFGTQVARNDEGKLVVQALEDPARVEERRAAIGIFPLESFLRIIEQQTGERPGFLDAAPPPVASTPSGPPPPVDPGKVWDRVFLEEPPRFVAEPSEFLVRCTERMLAQGILRPGARVLDLGSGEGRNAVWLASRGLDVTALDASSVGLEKTRAAAAAKNVTVRTVQADLFEYDLGDGAWDLVAMIYMNPAITILDRVKRAVRPGGLLLIEGFGSDHEEASPPAWSLYKPNQLLEALHDWRILQYEDGVFPGDWSEGRPVPVVRVLARRPAE